MSILRLLLVVLVWTGASTAAWSQGVDVYRLRDSFYPGTSGNQVIMRIRNVAGIETAEFVPKPQLPLKWISVTSITPASAKLAPGQTQDFVLTFAISAAVPPGGSETATVFFEMGPGIPSARFDLVVDFAAAPALVADADLKELDFIDMEDSFKAGTVGNAVVFKVQNTTAFPVKGLNLRPELPARYLTLDRIEPKDVDLDPGKSVDITAWFTVRPDAEVGAFDVIGFHFDTRSDNPLPIPRYRLKAKIEAGEPVHSCNSAVDSGGDEGGGVEVDLGDFTGKAGFTWEMYDIKDQMDVTVGGQTKTTGCVSGSGTFEFDVAAGARTATVKVKPNCEATSGTAWNFTFECPLSSTVTADGTGNPPPGGGTTPPGGPTPPGGNPPPTGPIAAIPSVAGPAGQLSPASPRPSAPGNPVRPAPPPPPATPPSGVPVAESEDNGAASGATPAPVGSTVTGAITQLGDGDNFAVQLARQGELTVAFPAVPAGIDIAFRVLDAAGNQIMGWQGGAGPGAAYSGWLDVATPGNYVIEVRDGNNDAFSPTPYAMVTSFIPTADPAEPNDVPATATLLDWNQALLSNILPLGDGDTYSVKADRRGQLTLAFRQTAPTLNMAFRVLDQAGNQIWGWQGAAANGQLYTGIADLPAPGTYLIEVRDGNNDARSAVPYELVASLDPAYDGAEPNDSIATATAIAFGAQVWANILPLGDGDVYAVDLPHQGELAVGFTASAPELNMAFRVLDAAGNQVWGWQGAAANGGLYTGRADINTAGRYFIEVRDGNNDARSTAPYGLVTAFTPTADTGEPNDNTGVATSVALGAEVQANILPLGDGDNYAVDLPHQGELGLAFTGSPAELNMAFRVLAANGNQVWGWQGAAANGELYTGWADISTPGRHMIEVRDGNNDARSSTSYTLVATHKPTDDIGEPNDSIGLATPVALGAEVRANILPLGEGDYYRFTAPGDKITVQFSQSPATLNMAFRVLALDGNQVSGWQAADVNGKLFSAEAVLPGPGSFVLEVRDGSNDARAAEPYAVSIFPG